MDSDRDKCDYCNYKTNYNLLCLCCQRNFIICKSCSNSNKCSNKNNHCNKCHYENCAQCWNIYEFKFLNYDLQNKILAFLLSLKRINITNKIIPKYVRHDIVHYIVINV